MEKLNKRERKLVRKHDKQRQKFAREYGVAKGYASEVAARNLVARTMDACDTKFDYERAVEWACCRQMKLDADLYSAMVEGIASDYCMTPTRTRRAAAMLINMLLDDIAHAVTAITDEYDPDISPAKVEAIRATVQSLAIDVKPIKRRPPAQAEGNVHRVEVAAR